MHINKTDKNKPRLEVRTLGNYRLYSEEKLLVQRMRHYLRKTMGGVGNKRIIQLQINDCKQLEGSEIQFGGEDGLGWKEF